MVATRQEARYLIIAARMGFVQLDQLDQALADLDQQEYESLAELLQERGLISKEQDKIIQEKLAEDFEDAATRASVVEDADRQAATRELEGPPLADGIAGGVPFWQEDKLEERITLAQEGRYTIRKVHGRGGQAKVLLAFDEHLGREVALKELIGEGVGTEVTPTASQRTTHGIVRFLREARVTGRLEHPNIVPIYELARREDGSLFYTMRFVRGKTLAQKIKECKNLEERLRLLGVFWDVCKAIAYAHGRGVVHRDIKPANIMVGEFDETVVLDWGIAKVRGLSDLQAGDIHKELKDFIGASDMTTAGTTLGTPSYMSPEQARGEIDSIDERSDVWGLGAMLYEILTGKPPYRGRQFQETIKRVQKAPLRPVREIVPDVSPELAAVAKKALQREREERYQSAKDLADEVGAYMTGGRVSAYQYSSWELFKRFAAQNKTVIVAASLIFAVILAALVMVSFTLQEKNRAYQSERQALVQEQQERRLANYHLAQAYTQRAAQLVKEHVHLDARIMLAASLVHNPEHPKSPYHHAGFRKDHPDSQELRIENASEFYALGLGNMLELHRRFKAPDTMTTHCFSPDGRFIAAGTYSEKKVWVWDIEQNKRIHEFPGMYMAYTPDGKRIATGRDKQLFLFDAASGEKLAELQVDSPEPLRNMAYSPTEDLLATAWRDGKVRVWKNQLSAPPRVFSGHVGPVYALAFTPDGRIMASSGADKTVRVWEQDSGRSLQILKGHESQVLGLDISRDGKLLASGGADTTVRIWDLATGKELHASERQSGGWSSVSFSADGKLLAAGNLEYYTSLFSVKTGEKILTARSHKGFVYDTSFSPDGSRLATSAYDKSLVIWRFLPATRITLEGHTARVDAVDFSPDGRLVATCGWDKRVAVWERATGKHLCWLDGHTQLVAELVFSPDSKRLASAAFDRSVRIWDVASGKALHVLAHEDALAAMDFSPDGKTLACGEKGGKIKLWDSHAGKLLHTLEGHKNWMRGLVFTSEGRELYSASWDKTIRVWDPKKGKQLREMDEPEAQQVEGVALSSDDKLLAWVRGDHKAVVWDIQKKKNLLTVDGNAVRFSSDDKLVVTTHGAWRISDGMMLFRTAAWPMALASDRLIYASGDGKLVHLYPLDFSLNEVDPGTLLKKAEDLAGKKLDGFQLTIPDK